MNQERWNGRSAVFCLLTTILSALYLLVHVVGQIVRTWLEGGA